uniref:Immunoglobulin domain-containing protein n=1 Tax=Esox lucius TaxID=8010 RepID=A0A3P8ZU81_ESOLU
MWKQFSVALLLITMCAHTLTQKLNCRDYIKTGGLLVRKQEGDNITIHCSTSQTDRESLTLFRRFTKETEVFNLYKETKKVTLQDEFKSRMYNEGEFHNMSLTIKHLTTEDSGVYWCTYIRFNKANIEAESVLLVVTGELIIKRALSCFFLICCNAINQ